MRGLVVLALLLPAAPVRSGDPGADRGVLSELWQRRVLSPEAETASSADLALLLRMRRAESAGALTYLRARYHALRGLAVLIKSAGEEHLRLTKDGFERYLFSRSQDALAYFQTRDIGYKWAFQLEDLDGRKLFDAQGRLTEAGEELYARAAVNQEAHWRLPGQPVDGNRAWKGEPVSAAPVAARAVRRPARPQPQQAQSRPQAPPDQGMGSAQAHDGAAAAPAQPAGQAPAAGGSATETAPAPAGEGPEPGPAPADSD